MTLSGGKKVVIGLAALLIMFLADCVWNKERIGFTIEPTFRLVS